MILPGVPGLRCELGTSRCRARGCERARAGRKSSRFALTPTGESRLISSCRRRRNAILPLTLGDTMAAEGADRSSPRHFPLLARSVRSFGMPCGGRCGDRLRPSRRCCSRLRIDRPDAEMRLLAASGCCQEGLRLPTSVQMLQPHVIGRSDQAGDCRCRATSFSGADDTARARSVRCRPCLPGR